MPIWSRMSCTDVFSYPLSKKSCCAVSSTAFLRKSPFFIARTLSVGFEKQTPAPVCF